MAKAAFPKGVRAVFDNGGKTADRFTIVYGKQFDQKDGAGRVYFLTMGCCERPDHPQGIGCTQQTPVEFWTLPHFKRDHKPIAWDTLPERVRKVVERDLFDAGL